MAYSLRTLVSGDKRRYTADGYNLDMTYITPRLIAMGLPGKGVSTLWRNKVEEVASFLNKNHYGHYRIFSLGKSAADFLQLRNTTSWFGWSSKKSPPLELLNRILLSINDWLAQNPQNVAVIHCKEGRERSGVVIAAYLVKSGVFSTPNEALDYYATQRSKYHEGVQTPSQIRYVNYITSIHQMPAPRKIFLRKMILRPVPDYAQFTPIVDIFNSGVVPVQPIITLKGFKQFQKLDFEVPLEMSCPIQGDTYIQVSNRVKLLGLKTNLPMFRVGFHTSFVPNRWVLTKAELDGELAGPVHDDKLRRAFTVEFLFTDGPFDPLPVDPAQVVPQTNYQTASQSYNQAYAQVPSMQGNYMAPQYVQAPNNYPESSYASTSYPQVVQAQKELPSQIPYGQIPQDGYQNESSNTVQPNVASSSFMTENSTAPMGWYHPSENSTVASMPPPVNRNSKENHQKLSEATDAVARATERLKMIQMNNLATNDQPVQKTQM